MQQVISAELIEERANDARALAFMSPPTRGLTAGELAERDRADEFSVRIGIKSLHSVLAERLLLSDEQVDAAFDEVIKSRAVRDGLRRVGTADKLNCLEAMIGRLHIVPAFRTQAEHRAGMLRRLSAATSRQEGDEAASGPKWGTPPR